MDIFQYAMDMEKESESFYRELGDNCGNAELKGVFDLLAAEEVKHYNVLQAMRDGGTVQEAQSTLVQDAKSVFDQIRAKGDFSCGLDQVALYKQAQGVEQKAKSHYQDRADQSQDAAAKDLFLRLAAQEDKHYWMLDNIIELVSRPEQWLEDAEWTNWETY